MLRALVAGVFPASVSSVGMGAIAVASTSQGSTMSCACCARVIAIKWWILFSCNHCSGRSSPSGSMSKSTIDMSSISGLLLGFSYMRDMASALQLVSLGMCMNLMQNHVSHCDQRIWCGPACDLCMNDLRASWSVTTRISGSPSRTSSHFLSASITPNVSCSYVKYERCASVNFLDINPAGRMVFQLSPWLKYAPHPDGQASHTTQTGFGLFRSIGRSVSFFAAIAFIISKHLLCSECQVNGIPLAHIPDSGVVYAETLGRKRDMYSMRPKNLCTS